MKNYTGTEIIGLTKNNWSEFYSPVHETAVYLHRVRDLSFAKTCELLKKFDLSASEFDILATLRRSPKPHILTPTELQRSLLITSGGLTKLLYQLESDGLISRSMDKKDKRSKLVHLSSKGKKTIEKAMVDVHQSMNDWLSDTFEKEELEQFKCLLGKAAAVLENEDSE